MERIQELLGRITDLSDDELNELKDLILQQFDVQSGEGGDDSAAPPPADGETPPGGAMSAAKAEALQELADAAKAFKAERERREQLATTTATNTDTVNSLRGETPEGSEFADDPKKKKDARRFEHVSYEDVIARNLQVMDTAAIALCRDHNMANMAIAACRALSRK